MTDLTVTPPNQPSGTLPQPVTRAAPGLDRGDLSAGDRRTLRRALNMIKAARSQATSADAKEAGKARQRLTIILSYLAGFFDGKAQGRPNLNAGFQSIIQSSVVKIDPEAQLDELEKNLEGILADQTRFWNIVIGGGLILVGIALKQL